MSQCRSITNTGDRCQRQALPRRRYCWQHDTVLFQGVTAVGTVMVAITVIGLIADFIGIWSFVDAKRSVESLRFFTNEHVTVKHLRNQTGKVTFDDISFQDVAELNNASGIIPRNVSIELAHNYRHQIIDQLSNSKVSAQMVQDMITRLYNLPEGSSGSEGLLETLCLLSIEIPARHKARIKVEWKELWAEGVIEEIIRGETLPLGTYTVFLGYEPCSIVEQENIPP